MFKYLSEKNFLFLISFFLIIFIFINYIHNTGEKFNVNNEGSLKLFDNLEFKNNINEKLVAEESYEAILNKDCQVTGSMHDRHKVRWVKSFFLKNIFQFSNKLNSNSPYYLNILIHSFIIFLTLIFLNKAFNLNISHIFLFLLYICFVFQQSLGEYSYSIFEMFFLTVSLLASKKKNITLFILATSLAVLNRESGFIILFTWLIFNKNFKQFLLIFLIVFLIFIFLNLKTINCIIDPKFFIPLEYQEGQVNLSDIKSLSSFSFLKLLLINFLIPFGLIAYNFYKFKIKNTYFGLIVLIYLVTFIIATPLHHIAVRLILLPLIFLSFFPPPKQAN
tara:strand:+ start:1219 stop:2220 length:1002 start_codon:yes stop_codon:yes gene_type:complete